MNDLLQRLAVLSPEKRAILVSRLKAREGDGAARISARKQFTPAPLSFAQQRLWFLDHYEPDSHFYNVCAAFRLSGILDVAAVERSFTEIVKRHEALRTVFLDVEGQPLQHIQTDQVQTLLHHDLSLVDATEREIQSERIVAEEMRRPFELRRGPLFRVTLMRLGAQEHILLLNTHHIVSDAWSIGVLVREFSAFYNSFATEQPLTLPTLPIQYADFAVWQREGIENGELAGQFAYWKQQLAGAASGPLALPTDHARPAIFTYQGGCQQLSLSPELTQSLKALGLQHNATLFMTLLAGFYSLLRCYCGADDIRIGTPISGRNYAETHGLIGLFVNTLVLRCKHPGPLTFRGAMASARQTVVDAFANQDVPFEKLVDALQPERNPSHTPLFQAMFVLQNAPAHDLGLHGLAVTELELQTESSKFDLTLAAREDGPGISLAMNYASDLFEPATVERMIRHYRDLLEQVVADPDQVISPSLLLSESEQQEQLVEWNGKRVEYRRESRVEELFAEQAERRGEAVALVAGEEPVSYGELNERANRLAHNLRRRGVGPEVMVGVCLERSVELIVSLLGILKAGGAYLPLDPEYPESRRVYMMRDAGARVLLTSGRLGAGFAQELGSAVEVVSLERAAAELAAESSTNPERRGGTDNLAYVIYTSGSTGAPKGVQIPQQGLMNLVSWHREEYQVTAADRATLLASLSFDASVWELWPYLCSGASVYLVEDEVRGEPQRLIRWLAVQGITISFLPTPLAEAVLSEELPDGEWEQLALRLLLTGGDRLHGVAGGRRRFELVNHYGPTECSVVGTSARVALDGNGDGNGQPPPIGRAIANTEAYVLDGRQQLAPVGVVGELYLGGDGLARGYLGAAAQTAERFVPHPYSREGGARLYRTGDLVRYDRAGQLEFVGRVDEQLKIRGYRIEPGEVESALRGHESVSEAVVLGRAEESGEKRLVAYVVARTDLLNVPTANELRVYLREQLPEYMVPAAFVYLAELPLNANGKVDRAALPAPEWQRLAGEREYVAPRTATEEVLCGIWAEVLRVERVGVYDNFFELGGDSILSIQIVAKARQRGLQLSPKQLFRYQRVADLAAQVKQSELGDAPQGEVTGEVALTPIQHWFFEQKLPRVGHWNQALLLESEAQLSEELLEQSWRELVKHHDGLRRRYRCEAGEWRQEIRAATAADVVVDSYELAGLEAAEQRRELQERADELQAKLELEQGPLVRVAWFGRGAAGGWLLVIIHHLVVDGVSWRILLEDFAVVYEQLRAGAAVTLPAKTNSVQQWGEQVAAYAQSEAVAAEAEYWLAAGAVPVKPLPRDYEEDREGGGNEEERAGLESGSLTATETQALLQEVPGRYQTQITEVLVTGLVEAVWKWSGERLVRLALEGHGREAVIGGELDVTRTVGWFTTLYPVVVDLRQVYETGAALKAVKEQLRGIPQRGTGYGVLRYLRDEVGARLSEQAEAELSFNYLGQFDQVLSETQWLRAAAEGSGVARYGGGQRRYLLDVSSSVVGGQLQVSVHYSTAIHERETMARLLTEYLTQLRRIIAHCQGLEVVEYSPSDFPQARLSQRELGEFLAEIGE